MRGALRGDDGARGCWGGACRVGPAGTNGLLVGRPAGITGLLMGRPAGTFSVATGRPAGFTAARVAKGLGEGVVADSGDAVYHIRHMRFAPVEMMENRLLVLWVALRIRGDGTGVVGGSRR